MENNKLARPNSEQRARTCAKYPKRLAATCAKYPDRRRVCARALSTLSFLASRAPSSRPSQAVRAACLNYPLSASISPPFVSLAPRVRWRVVVEGAPLWRITLVGSVACGICVLNRTRRGAHASGSACGQERIPSRRRSTAPRSVIQCVPSVHLARRCVSSVDFSGCVRTVWGRFGHQHTRTIEGGSRRMKFKESCIHL